MAGFQDPPRLVEIPDLAEADIVVEAAPAPLFERIALPALEAGRILVPASVGALLPRLHLVRLARKTGARIVIPTGALLGLDAVECRRRGSDRQRHDRDPQAAVCAGGCSLSGEE